MIIITTITIIFINPTPKIHEVRSQADPKWLSGLLSGPKSRSTISVQEELFVEITMITMITMITILTIITIITIIVIITITIIITINPRRRVFLRSIDSPSIPR